MAGGIGTLAEMAMMWSLVQVGELSPRPIVLVGDLWQRTLAAFNNEAYIRPAHRELLTLVEAGFESVGRSIEAVQLRSALAEARLCLRLRPRLHLDPSLFSPRIAALFAEAR